LLFPGDLDPGDARSGIRTSRTGTRASRLAMGRQLGADVVVDSRQTDPVAAVMAATGDKGDKAAAEKQQASVREWAVGLKFIETCTRSTPKSVVDCGLKAKSMEEIARCDQPES